MIFFFSSKISQKICNFLRKDFFLENTCALCPCFLTLPSTQARCLGRAFRGRAPQITACALPSKKRAPCAQKESNRPGATRVCFGACAPPKYCLCPPSVSKVLFQDKKHECTPKLSLRFCAEDLFFVFTLEFVGKKRDPHHQIPPRPVRQ